MDESILQYIKRKYNLLIGKEPWKLSKLPLAMPILWVTEEIETARPRQPAFLKILSINSEEVREAINSRSTRSLRR